MPFKRNGKQHIWPFVAIVLALSLFVAHYMLKPTIDAADPVWAYFVGSFFPHTGNVIILVSVIAWFGAPTISDMLVKRKEGIVREIDESKRQKELASSILKEAQSSIEGLDEELTKMRVSYDEAAANVCESIAQDAERNVQRLAKDAQISTSLQAEVAKKAFERELMQRAIDKASVEISARLAKDPSIGARLIDQSIESLEISPS